MYKLKDSSEHFEMVDGPHAGKKFARGVVYEEIPPNESHRFEPVTPADNGDAQEKTKLQNKKSAKKDMKEE